MTNLLEKACPSSGTIRVTLLKWEGMLGHMMVTIRVGSCPRGQPWWTCSASRAERGNSASWTESVCGRGVGWSHHHTMS